MVERLDRRQDALPASVLDSDRRSDGRRAPLRGGADEDHARCRAGAGPGVTSTAGGPPCRSRSRPRFRTADGPARPPRPGQGDGAARGDDRTRVRRPTAAVGRAVRRRELALATSASTLPASSTGRKARKDRPTSSSTRSCKTPPTSLAARQRQRVPPPDRAGVPNRFRRRRRRSRNAGAAFTEAGLAERAIEFLVQGWTTELSRTRQQRRQSRS